MNALVRLYPTFVLHEFARGRREGRMRACVLMLDLSGFTALTEALMRAGRIGAEQLSEIINDLFSPMTDAVARRGGFVATFAGDAMTAVFPAGDAPDAVRAQAVAAAFEARSVVAERGRRVVAGTEHVVQVKIGIGEGDVDWGLWSEGDDLAYWFRGPGVEEAAFIQSGCKPMDVLAPERLHHAYRALADAEAHPDGILLTAPRAAPVPPAPVAVPALPEPFVRFVPPAIRRLRVDGEFRLAQCVFVNVDAGVPQHHLLALVARMFALLNRHGGYFNKLDFGDKGGVFVLLWGAPRASEDDVRRTLGFTADLLDWARDRVSVKIGIAQGVVFAGFVGGPGRAEYTVLGDAANIAARLMGKAPAGEAHVAKAIMRDGARAFRFDALGTRAFKGKSEAVEVYRLAGRGASTAVAPVEPALVGRERELAAVADAVDASLGLSGPCLLTLRGEGGLGKSRTLRTARDRFVSAAPDGLWLDAVCDEVMRTSWHPVSSLLTRYFAQEPGLPLSEAMRRVEERIGELTADERIDKPVRDALAYGFTLLGALVGLHWPDGLADLLEPDERRRRTIETVRLLLVAESTRRPLAVIVDDCQWIDDDSAQLLKNVLHKPGDGRLLFVLASRAPLDPLLPKTTPLAGRRTDVALALLDAEQTAQLAATMLGGPIAGGFAAYLHRLTNGNPYYIEQFVEYFRRSDLLAPDAAGHIALARDDVEPPSSIAGIIMARLDGLHAAVRDAVCTAAVLGQRFEEDVLAGMLREPDDLADRLVTVERERIWSAVAAREWTFLQILFRDTTYGSLLSRTRKTLHAEAARAIEAVHAERLELYYETLAHHLLEGGEPDRASDYLAAAVDRLKHISANGAALELCRRQIAVLGDLIGAVADDARRRVLAARLVETHALAGGFQNYLSKFDGAIEVLTRGLALCDDPRTAPLLGDGRPLLAARLQRELASTYTHLGRFAEADAHALAGLDALAPVRREREARVFAATLHHRRGLAKQAAGELTDAVRIGRDALAELMADPDESPGRARAEALLHGLLSGALMKLGRLDDAEVHFVAGTDLRRRFGDPDMVATGLSNLADFYVNRGEHEKAIPMIQEALAFYEKIGDPFRAAINRCNLGAALLAGGRPEAAEPELRRAVAYFEANRVLWGLPETLRKLALTARARGRIAEAAGHAEAALRWAETAAMRDEVEKARALLADLAPVST